MPSTPSPNLRIELQETGESLNSWGLKLNQGLILLEQAVSGVLRKAINGNTTLIAANYVADEARNAELIFDPGPSLTGPWVLTIPAVPKSYFVRNLTGYPITITAGGVFGILGVGRQGRVSCIGVDVMVFDPVAAAAAVTEQFAQSAATSAQTAMTSASTATTRRDQALAARDEAYTARDVTLAARDTTLGYRNAAAASAAAAAASAAGVNLPAITSADAGKVLTVKPDGSGYAPLPLNVPLFKPITMTTPTAGATNVGAGGTYTFVVEAFPGDTTGFYPDYPVPLASRFVDVFEPGGNAAVKRFVVSGTGVAFPVSFTGSGLLTSHAYEFQAGYQAADGSSVLSQRVQATTTAVFKPGVGQAYQGGFLAFENFGDGGLSDLVVAPKSTESSRKWVFTNTTTLANAFSRLSGQDNTAKIRAIDSDQAGAAQVANATAIGGVAGSLGAIDQLRCIAFNLAPNKAVEAAFKAGGSEVFNQSGANYWSSTEVSASGALSCLMGTDASQQGPNSKGDSQIVRAIKSVAVTPPIAIGTYVAAQGGWLAAYFTDFSGAAPVTYGLFVSDKTVEVTRAFATLNQQTSMFSRTNGNSNAIILKGDANSDFLSTEATNYPAFAHCRNLVHGGKDDWYLGAIDEMLAIARMNASLPSGQPLSGSYWSSTEIDGSTARPFGSSGSGDGAATAKSTALLVRPIRRAPLSQLAA